VRAVPLAELRGEPIAPVSRLPRRLGPPSMAKGSEVVEIRRVGAVTLAFTATAHDFDNASIDATNESRYRRRVKLT